MVTKTTKPSYSTYYSRILTRLITHDYIEDQQPEDPRVQSIPFTTGRATLIEIAKAKQMLLSCTWEQRSAFDSVSGLLLELPKLDKEKALLALCAVARDTDSIQQIFQLVLTPVEAVQPLGGFQSATFFLLHSLCARGSLAEAQHLLHLITAIPNEASSAATCTPKILLSMQNGENGTCLHAASINGFGETRYTRKNRLRCCTHVSSKDSVPAICH
ncbi:hypothetical protein Pelo_470 [Pelomyxa schiedti]|nr:hypothetical protein Pelo_470 [Pelomyxa schiedti]